MWATNKQWKILKELGISHQLTCLLRNLHAGQEATVRTRHGKTNWFKIGEGIWLDCILSPCLFNLHAEYIMQNGRLDEAQPRIRIAGRNINNLRYTDQFSSVQSLSYVRLFETPWTAACQDSLSFTISQSLSNTCPLSRWCHPTISSSVTRFSSCLQCFLESGSFQMSWLFALGGQITGASASALVLPINIQGWFTLGLTDLISLFSKGLSRVFSST